VTSRVPPDFERVVAGYRGTIRRIAAVAEGNRALAQELEQEMLIAVWRALPRYRADASLKTFVARVAQYRATTHVACEARRPRTQEMHDALASDAPDPGAQAEADDMHARVAAALRGLPAGLREVAALTLEGMSPGEIADVLGVTPNAVSLRLLRAKALLAQALGGGMQT
jgi:RNA polymerase sigma-70 factor (ECF subfamily)